MLLSAALAIANLHACRHGGAWHNRLPVIGLDGLNTASREGKIYQAFCFAVLVVMPLLGIGRSLEVANRGTLSEQAKSGEMPRWHASGEWRLVFLSPHTNQLRLMREGDGGGCGGHGAEIGWWTPIFMVGTLAAAILLALSLLLALVRRHP